jgi:diguanylate cyclase (GGDEF)-like protein
MIHSPEILKVLESAPLFHKVPGYLLATSLSESRLHPLAPGQVLLVPGQSNNTIYIILSGRLRIQTKESEVEPIAILGEGECVGEMSMLEQAPVSAYVIAATNCKLLAIDHASMWELIDNSHAAAHNMLNILTSRIRNTNQIVAENYEREQGFSGDSMVDELTGLYNQHSTQRKLDRLVHRDNVDQKTSCLLMLEMDRFKEFCAKYGQLGGDQALRNIAHTILFSLRPGDQAGRYLIERFVAFLPNTSLPDAYTAAERLKSVVNQSLVVLPSGDALPSISISLGISQMQPDDTLVDLLARADKALLLAKKSGGNRAKLLQ